ncbi:MAG: peptidyl-prolyl cis-trans isomerase [Dongiaceae bacterium]
MLTALRSKASSWIIKVLFLVLIATFGVWGVSDVFHLRSGDTVIANVGPERITEPEFSRQLRIQVDRLQPMFQGKLDSEMAKQIGLPRQVLANMVNSTLFDVEAQRLHLSVPDSVVQQRVVAAFNNGLGQLDRARLSMYLDQSHLNEAMFLDTVRKDIARNELFTAIAGGVRVPDQLVNLIYGYRAEKRVASTVFIADSSITDVGQPDDKALEAFHKENASRYQAPEYRAVTLVTLRPEDIAGEIGVSEDEIAEEYKAHAAEYDVPERRHLEQIIFKDEASAKAAADQLKGGASFADVAQQVTGKPPADLGSLAKSEVLGVLAEPSFAAGANGVTAPVKTGFGWHIVHVLAIEPGHKATLAEVHDRIKGELARRKAIDALDSLSKQLEDALAGGAPLDQAAAKLKLKVEKIAAIDANGKGPDDAVIPGVTGNQQIVPAIFNTTEGQTTDLIDIGEGSYAIVKVDGVTPEAVRPLDKIRDRVIADWQQAQREKLAAEKAKKLLERLNGGEDLAKIAAELQVPVKTTQPFTRDAGDPAADLSPEAAAKLFGVKVGQGVASASGAGQVLARLDRIDPANPAADQAQVDRLRADLREKLANDLLVEFSSALREQIPVTTDNRAIEALF